MLYFVKSGWTIRLGSGVTKQSAFRADLYNAAFPLVNKIFYASTPPLIKFLQAKKQILQ